MASKRAELRLWKNWGVTSDQPGQCDDQVKYANVWHRAQRIWTGHPPLTVSHDSVKSLIPILEKLERGGRRKKERCYLEKQVQNNGQEGSKNSKLTSLQCFENIIPLCSSFHYYFWKINHITLASLKVRFLFLSLLLDFFSWTSVFSWFNIMCLMMAVIVAILYRIYHASF